MIRRIRTRWLMGRSSSKSLTNNSQLSSEEDTNTASESLHEVAIYIHRFHNLDLFQQGWYQIKVSMRLDHTEYKSVGTPARVVQYEGNEQGSVDAYGVWTIDDVENSFSTQPFFIKYAKQDVFLSIMISFVLSLHANEGPSTAGVVLKFELMYTSVLNNGTELHNSLNACPVAVHEFRLPPKALLGLHSYCPVHFDAFHAVRVDTSVHIIMVKASWTPLFKVLRPAGSVDNKQILPMKELIAAREILLDDLQRISRAIDQVIDLSSSVPNLENTKFGFIIQSNMGGLEEVLQVSHNSQNGVKKSNSISDLRSDGLLHSVSSDDLFDSLHFLGDQILHLWNTFLMFHRANKTKILEFLRDGWADGRRAEWSIWMIHSKVEMPLDYLNSRIDAPSFNLHGKSLSHWNFSGDPVQTASIRAELHRQSIAKMRINSRSLQDMHMYGDPLCVPIIIVEHVSDAPLHNHNGNPCISHLNEKHMHDIPAATKFGAVKQSTGRSLQLHGLVLKIVVFVHGFQGNHLDLRLIRNQWLLIDPKIHFLMSEANEDKTYGDFREMGLRLAQEVVAFTKRKMDKASRTGNLNSIKLSFVGHSIGNIIIRAALTESIMEPYRRFLYTYFSLSGPHLGYMYCSNSLFNSGLWLLKKLKGTQCIHQLTFSDDPDLMNTFLYKLSKEKTLENFKNVILVSSPQDGYVPYHSARIEMCPASFLDYSKRGKVFWEMLNNCLSQLQAPSTDQRIFMRCDVNFDTSSHGRNLNTIIGRTAHVEFLESDIFARLIMWSFPQLFR
ncbi:uncharacterized protein LOC126680935 [Mercurialis annua]|uniref:uncharacterized protein LOC126680935 n=1 Tax=Mercurialis annua TaxID=3986 RepID=UPI00215E1200|nr:uncharacterized protein LOC126680935 [Mercurialis annua]